MIRLIYQLFFLLLVFIILVTISFYARKGYIDDLDNRFNELYSDIFDYVSYLNLKKHQPKYLNKYQVTEEYFKAQNKFVTPVFPSKPFILCNWLQEGKERYKYSSLSNIKNIPDNWFNFYIPFKKNVNELERVSCNFTKPMDPNYYLYIRIRDDDFIKDPLTINPSKYGTFLKFDTFDYINLTIKNDNNKVFNLVILLREVGNSKLQPVIFDRNYTDNNGNKFTKIVPGSKSASYVDTTDGYYYLTIKLDSKYFFEKQINPESTEEEWIIFLNKLNLKVDFIDYDSETQIINKIQLPFIGNSEKKVLPVSGSMEKEIYENLPDCSVITIPTLREYIGKDKVTKFGSNCKTNLDSKNILNNFFEWFINPQQKYSSAQELYGFPESKFHYTDINTFKSYKKFIYPLIFILSFTLFLFALVSLIPEKLMNSKIKKLVQAIHNSRDGAKVQIPYKREKGEVGILAREIIKSLVAQKETEKARKKEAKALSFALKEKTKFQILSVSEQEKSKSYQDSLYVLKHEINNCLTEVFINSKNEVLIERAKFATKFMENVEAIFDQKNELDFLKSRNQAHQLTNIINQFVSLLPDEQKKDIEVKVSDTMNKKVYCSLSTVYQILYKFIENALEYRTPTTKVRIGIANNPPLGFDGLYVYNEGNKIEGDKLKRLFRPLSSRQLAKKKNGHLGIGTAMARAYAISIGGATHAMNTKNGVSFIIFMQSNEDSNPTNNTTLSLL